MVSIITLQLPFRWSIGNMISVNIGQMFFTEKMKSRYNNYKLNFSKVKVFSVSPLDRVGEGFLND
jgi:hypothetical protein